MKRRMMNIQEDRGGDLVLWRRFGDGFWFQVRSTMLASDRRSLKLVDRLRGEQVGVASVPLKLRPGS